ncbi:MAG: hypothetical protein VX944_03915 [Myxococcota bacterium]|nr:hypothetical protein [Myxococcota bacterium]
MNDAIAERAQALARWLSTPAGGPIPDSLEPEVVEAIIALRPERAPPHTITIEAVLAAITEGPLMDPAVADALQRWLAAGPGTDPPPVLPVGVVETTYALRPEMAPSLGVSIDDVLAGVTKGPLASEAVDGEDGHAQGRATVGVAPVDSIAQQALVSVRRKRWTGTAVGMTAMAAAVVLFVAPMTDEAIQGPDYFPDDAVAQADEPAVTEQTVTLLESARTPIDSAGIEARAPDASPIPTASRAAAEPRGLRSPPEARTQPTNRIELDDAGGSPAVPAPAPTPAGAARIAPADAQIHASAAGPIAEEAAPSDSVPRPAVGHKPPAAVAHRAHRTTGRLDVEVAEVVPHAQMEDSSSVPPSAAAGGAAHASRAPRGTAAIQTLHQARTLLESGRFDRALRAVESGLEQSELDPISAARLWRLKAEIFTKMGRTNEARLARETAAKLDPLR